MTSENHRARNDRAEARKLMARAREEGRHHIIQWFKPLFEAADAEGFRIKAGFDFASPEQHRQFLEKSGRKIPDDIELASLDGEYVAMMLNREFYRLADFAVADAAIEPTGEKAERLNRISKSARAALKELQGMFEGLGFSETYLTDMTNGAALDIRSFHKEIVELIPFFRDGNSVFDALPPQHHLRSVVNWLGRISDAAGIMGAALTAFPDQSQKYAPKTIPIYNTHSRGMGERNAADELALGLVRIWQDCTGGRRLGVSKNNEIVASSATIWAEAVLAMASERLPGTCAPSEVLENVVSAIRKNLGKRLAFAQTVLKKAAKA